MDFGIITFIITILIVGVLIFIAILLTSKRAYHFDVEAYQARFLAIENNLHKESPASFALSIIKADKLLDQAMTEMGLPGKTLGEHLKKSPSRFTELNSVWRAHKLRNAIAHEPDFEVSFTQAKNCLAVYKQALKDLGAI